MLVNELKVVEMQESKIVSVLSRSSRALTVIFVESNFHVFPSLSLLALNLVNSLPLTWEIPLKALGSK